MLHRVSLSLNKAANMMAVIFLSLMTVVILLGVFFRYFLLKPLPWSEDLGRYLMIWMSLVAVGVVMQSRRHVSVTIFVEQMPPKAKLAVVLFAHTLVVLFGFTMGWLSIEYLGSARPQISPSLHIDLWWVYLGFPFFSLLLIVSTIDRMVEAIKEFRNTGP